MSFTNDDILILAKAGFNATQIAALNQINSAPQQVPQQVPQGASIDDVLKSVQDLTSSVQKGFLQGSQQPQPLTAEDLLAQIINPPINDNK